MLLSLSPPLLVFFLMNCLPVFALHTTLSGSTLLSIPIRKNPQATFSNITHGSIIQQQHTSRGIRRLALMTGRNPPSDAELILALYERIFRLSKSLKRKYELEKTEVIMETFLANTPPTSSPRLARTAKNASPAHSMGLTIESNDIGYIGTVEIGNPARKFHLLIDSGSADLWVGGEGCQGDDGGDCGRHTFLGPLSSKSFVASTDDWATGYVSGSVAGYLAQDDIFIAGLQLRAHMFGIAMNESSDFTPDSIPFDGLLGLAKSEISQQRTPTLLQSLYTSNLISEPIVSYRIPRLSDNKNSGEVTLGGMDYSQFDPKTLVKTKNINKFGFWGLAVDGVKIGKKSMHWANRTILMDTGTTLIIAPKHDVDAIHSCIPGAKYDGSGWMVPCNMTTTLSFNIKGQVFPIEPRDITFYPLDDVEGYCMSGIAIGGVGPFYLDTDWLVGDVFLKNVYFSTDESRDEISIAVPWR